MLYPPSSRPPQLEKIGHARGASASMSPGAPLRSPTPPRGLGKDQGSRSAPGSPASSVGSQGPRQGWKVSFTAGPAEAHTYNPMSPTTSVGVLRDQAPLKDSGLRPMKKKRKKDEAIARGEAAGRKGQSKGKKGRGKGKGKSQK